MKMFLDVEIVCFLKSRLCISCSVKLHDKQLVVRSPCSRLLGPECDPGVPPGILIRGSRQLPNNPSLGPLARSGIPEPYPRSAKLRSVVSVYFSQCEQAVLTELEQQCLVYRPSCTVPVKAA